MPDDKLSGDTPPAGGSVTGWLNGLREQDSIALQHLWQRYYTRLVEYARGKLHGPRRVADEEDVVASVLHSFYHAARENRFPQLADRDDLWRILMIMTWRKAIDANRFVRRRVRGGGNVRGESAILPDSLSGAGFDWLEDDEPTPEFAAMWNDELERMLKALGDERLRSVAIAKLEGLTNAEIAVRLNCAERTVVRSLALIRAIWQP